MPNSKKEDDIPWKDKIHSTPWYSCYRDGDRFLFVPKEKHAIGMSTAFDSAYKLASSSPIDNAIGYKITVMVGDSMTTEINRPYLELAAIKKEATVVELEVVREAI